MRLIVLKSPALILLFIVFAEALSGSEGTQSNSFGSLAGIEDKSAPKESGAVCLGAYIPKILRSLDEISHVSVTVDESEKMFFTRAPAIVFKNLDRHKTYMVRVFYDSQLEKSWKLRFDKLKVNLVKVWRSAGYWRLDPVPDGKCGLAVSL